VIAGLPPLAVTVNGYTPLPTELATVTVRLVDAPVAGFGEKLPVAPAGNPLTDIANGELKPPVRDIETA
jgi:hypothetical protein